MADKTDDLVIGVSTDLTPVQRAIKKLDADIAAAAGSMGRSFAEAGAKIDRSMMSIQDKINQATGVMRTSGREWTGALANQGKAMDEMRAKFDPVFAAAVRYRAELAELNTAYNLGAISAEVYSASLVELSDKHDAVARAARRAQAELADMAAAERLAATSADGQAMWNTYAGVGMGSGKSAQASAAAMVAELERLERIASQKAAQIGSAFAEDLERRLVPGTRTAARDSASVFAAEMERLETIAQQQAQQAGANFQAALNASFGIGGNRSSASASAAVFEELDRKAKMLRSTINPLAAAQDRYNAELAEYNMLAARGAISTTELAEAHALAKSRLDATVDSLNKVKAAGGVNRFNTGNLAAQFQDIGVTSAMGMNPLIIALQQGTQISAVLNEMGRGKDIVAGLGAAFMSVINPVSLVTIGLVAASAAAVQYGMSLWESTEDSEKALKEQADLIQRVAQRWGEAIPAIKAYADEQERLANETEDAQARQILMARAYEEIGRILPRVNEELSKFAQEASGGGWGGPAEDQATRLAASYDAVEQAFREYNRAVKDGEDTTEQYKRLQEALTDFTNNSAVPATGALRDAVSELADAYGDAADKASEAAAAFAQAASAEAAAAANRARFPGSRTTGRVTPTTAPGLGDAEFAARFGYDEYFNFPKEKKPRATRAPKRTPDDRFFEDIEAIKQRTIALAEERAQLGLSYEAQVKRKTAFDLEQKALKDVREAARQKGDQDWQNAQLTPEQIQKIDEVSAAYARQAEELRKAQDQLAFQKDLMRGVLGDLKSALADGKLEWEEMGQIALNVLDKITDKLLNEVIDAIFQVNNAGSSGGLLGFLGGLFGGGVSPTSSFWRPNTTAGAFFTSGFSTGGYTGPGPKNKPAGIVHAGEVVWSQDDIRKAGGVAAVEAMRLGGIKPAAIQAPVMPRLTAPGRAASSNVNFNMSVMVSGTGDKELMERMQKGVEIQMNEALRSYDREVLPARVNQIANDPHAVG